MMKINTKNDSFWFFFLLILALFLWLLNLGNVPLRDWDEGYYATVAQDMFQSGNWLYLTYADQPFLLKPPLIIWLINISYNLSGINEFTTRFPCALITAVGVPLLYLVAKKLFLKQQPAIFSSLVYLTLLPIVRHGRLAMIDGIINTFFILAIFSIVKSKKQPLWAIGFGFGIGLIALSKGILALALGGVLGIYILWDREKETLTIFLNKITQLLGLQTIFKPILNTSQNSEQSLLKNYWLWIGLCLGFLPVIIWYYFQIKYYGEQFIQVHFLQQNFDRLSTAVEGNSGSPWYYFLELVKYSLPWLLFLPNGLFLAWKKREESWSKLVLTGFFVFLGIITIMGTKLPWYIMPIYPFFALAIGYHLSNLYQVKKTYPKIYILFFFALSIIAIAGGIYLWKDTQEIITSIISSLLFITFLLTSQKLKQNSPNFINILVIGLYSSLILFITSNVWVWELNEAFAVKPVANLIKENTPPKTIIYTSFEYSRPSLDFYSDRQIVAEDNTTLEKLASTASYLLLDQETFDNLKLTNVKILGEVNEFILISTNNQ
ncbi:glycosyltransferase family 39 protein [Crocosphaera sp.]|uniref:ArnT family glycosyltransferase n=1 Tax=Crocosphaera sp. TaxID=2729996 RepID=UPI002623FC7E|nr:glycosyltransferase family 39 protein [Crocosphaera sp.]MDJ0579465.1 glycosyltransferase family 39 protein [Crocosphaera sp.]